MRFKVGDQVIVTSGKDKGIKSEIVAVYPEKNQVLVRGVNYMVKHVKPMPMVNRPGERIRKERPLSVAKVAIINDKGQPDRIGVKAGQKGEKVRVFKKTGALIMSVKKEDTQPKKSDKKAEKSKTKKSKK
ncbi:MAG TPA: 50S ribosomal protein L24 [Candidatus Woesebacteria bacterium]|nr:50S ribosomal protein L24 [Candidatus Woesebacteria bacterium]